LAEQSRISIYRRKDTKEKYENIMGKDVIVTNDRISKHGLYTIDRQALQKRKIDYTSENIINEKIY
jgi:hypothetical protein